MMAVDSEALRLTEHLRRLVAMPEHQKDPGWRSEFVETVWRAPLSVTKEYYIPGPDNHHYLALRLPAPNQEFEDRTVEELLDWAIQHGIGITILKEDGQSAFVFYLGNLVAWKLYGHPFPRWRPAPPSLMFDETLDGHRVQVGWPSAEILPELARVGLRKVMRETLKIKEPRAGLVQTPDHPPRVVFELSARDLGSDERVGQIFLALPWYLPPNIELWRIDSASGADWMVEI